LCPESTLNNVHRPRLHIVTDTDTEWRAEGPRCFLWPQVRRARVRDPDCTSTPTGTEYESNSPPKTTLFRLNLRSCRKIREDGERLSRVPGGFGCSPIFAQPQRPAAKTSPKGSDRYRGCVRGNRNRAPARIRLATVARSWKVRSGKSCGNSGIAPRRTPRETPRTTTLTFQGSCGWTESSTRTRRMASLTPSPLSLPLA
jgi:hypothetical protein